MPTLITTIEDSSPVISYSGNGGSDWTAGNSNDSSIDKYSDSSYTVTQVANATASFTFHGTGVQLYGAERANHGSYQVTIDSHVYDPANGQTNGTQEIFQTSLFQTVALTNGLHTVKVVNLGTTRFDLDFLTWETPIGEDQESLLSFTYQDSDPSFQYTPTSSWSNNPPNIGSFNGGSGHVTSTAGAYVEYTFKVRAAVAIYGPVGPQGAPYSVQLDNGATTNYSSTKQFYQPQTMLFQAAGLSSGAHTIRLRSEAWNNSALTLGIDYALVFSAPSLQPKPGLATGSILAIVFGILFAFNLIATGYLFSSRRRGMRVKDSSGTVIPFSQVEYQSLGSPSPGLPQPTSHTSMQTLYSGSRAVDTRTIHSEVSNATTQVISFSHVPDRKYRPDLSPPLSSQETADVSSRHSAHSDISEPGGSQQEVRKGGNSGIVVRPPVAAPPSYVLTQPE